MWTFLSDTNPKGRRDYRCLICDIIIPKGEVHVARRGISDDGPMTFRMHTECEEMTRDWDETDWETMSPDPAFREEALLQVKENKDG